MNEKNNQLIKEMQSKLEFLRQQYETIKDYPDQSLFFQNSQILEAWMDLSVILAEFERLDLKELHEKESKKDDGDEVIKYALTLYRLKNSIYRQIMDYDCPIRSILNSYKDNQNGDIFPEVYRNSMKFYCNERGESITVEMSKMSFSIRKDMYTMFEIYHVILKTIEGDIEEKLKKRFPSDEDIAKVINEDLRKHTLEFGEEMLKEMRKELTRNYKHSVTEADTPELWGKMLRADENAIKLAMRGELSQSNDPKQEHWGERIKSFMDKIGRNMDLFDSFFYYDQLKEWTDYIFWEEILSYIISEDYYSFREIVVRRNLILSEIDPKIKAQHEAWLNGRQENSSVGKDNSNGSVSARKSKLEEIITILKKGNFKKPATAENIELLLKTVFGEEQSLLDESDKVECDKMWSLVERGGGANRQEIVSGNLAGFLRHENLLLGSPTDICNDLYGKSNKQLNNYINKGNPNNCSHAFGAVIPFLRKYINKIIRVE